MHAARNSLLDCCVLQGVYAVFLLASNKKDRADCFKGLRQQEECNKMYGFIEPKFFPKLITFAMQFPLNQSVGELMVRTLYGSEHICAPKRQAVTSTHHCLLKEQSLTSVVL